MNVRIKLHTLSEEFLKLAILINNKIKDEIIYKTLLLKIFYPSQTPLLQILYKDKKYYIPILKNKIISEIVGKLWFSEYNWTFNFLNSSSAFKNIISHFGGEANVFNPQILRFKVSKMLKNEQNEKKKIKSKANELEELEAIKPPDSMKPMCKIAFNKTKYDGVVGVTDFRIDFSKPFEFYKWTRYSKDVRITNHIFSYFFFEKSPAFKLVFEFIVYLIFFAGIIYNMFELFVLRRSFQNYGTLFLNTIDGLQALSKGYTPNDIYMNVFNDYMTRNKMTSIAAAQLALYSKPSNEICYALLPNDTKNCDKFWVETDKIWGVATVFWALQIYFYLVWIQDIFEIIFIWKRHRKIEIRGKFLVDSVFCALNIYIYYIHFTKIDGKDLIVQDQLIQHMSDLEKVLAFFIFIMWFKIILYVKLTERFGVVVKVIENMIMKLGVFMIVLAIIILAFASICMNIFDKDDPENYGNFWVSLRSLIKIMFGPLSFDNFQTNELMAGLILNVYAFLTFVLLLNLIIAILANDFFEVSELGGLENAKTLYFKYLNMRADKYYSSIASMSPPFNFYIIFLAPILLLKRNPNLNKIAAIIGYVMYSFFYIIIYSVANLTIAIPICYFKLLISLIINLVIKRKNNNGFLIWLIWLLFGLFYMLWVFLSHDIPLFFKSMYFANPIKERLDEVTMEEIQLIDSETAKLEQKKEEFIGHGDLTELIKFDLEKINIKFRRDSLNSQKNQAMNILQTLKGKSAASVGFKNKAGEEFSDKVENQLNVFVEIDKMEIYSLLRQFNGINGKINIKRLRFLIAQIKLCKRFSSKKMTKKRQNKLINVFQVVETLPVEESIISIMGQNVRNQKVFENLLKKVLC